MSLKDLLGTWAQGDLSELASTFASNTPYPHVVIDNFFNLEVAASLSAQFPQVNENWYRYWNPIEKKFALNNFENSPAYKQLFATLQSEEFVALMKKVTGITNLENDPHLHGAGVHYHPKGGKLDMHLDYSIHPVSGKERRVNLIIYMNPGWHESYGGDLQLWDRDFTQPVKRVYPFFNRACIFQTSDISWHGMPQPLNCPDDRGRRSIAIYYVSDPSNNPHVRYKAQFRSLPDQPTPAALHRLYELRVKGIITPQILSEVYPNWETDPVGQGYWYQ